MSLITRASPRDEERSSKFLFTSACREGAQDTNGHGLIRIRLTPRPDSFREFCVTLILSGFAPPPLSMVPYLLLQGHSLHYGVTGSFDYYGFITMADWDPLRTLTFFENSVFGLSSLTISDAPLSFLGHLLHETPSPSFQWESPGSLEEIVAICFSLSFLQTCASQCVPQTSRVVHWLSFSCFSSFDQKEPL